MKQKKLLNKNGKEKRLKVCILAAAMIVLLAMPSFASNEADVPEAAGEEENVMTEEVQEENENEGSIIPDITEESIEDAGNEEDGAGGADKKDEEEEPEEAEEAQFVNKAPMMLRAGNGEKISYTAKRVGSNAGETSVFKVTSGGTTYTGACSEQGVGMKTSGKASITRIGNNTKIAKVIYYYTIALGDNNWWTSDRKTDKVGKILGMAHADDTDVTKRRMVECFCQIYNMGSTDWYNTVTSSSGGGWSKTTADKVRDYYRDIDTSNITVPAGFEIWKADSDGGAQSFIMWAYNPEGYVSMKKVSGNTNITN
ncbi:MAG: hypothetical protein IKG17_02040 [Mogibacterium sp.]|nr:hypothetical protein [Mogibacterium sp.]